MIKYKGITLNLPNVDELKDKQERLRITKNKMRESFLKHLEENAGILEIPEPNQVLPSKDPLDQHRIQLKIINLHKE